VLVLNAPSNPTGGSIDAATIEQLAEVAERHDLAVVSDEIYTRLTYGDGGDAPSVGAHPALRARSIVVDGFSKTYAMPGFRLGYAILPPALVERFVTLAINGHTCTPVFTQRAGIAALTGPQDSVEARRVRYERRRNRVVAALADVLPSPPVSEATFYVWFELPDGVSAADLLAQARVALAPGAGFGSRGVGWARLSLAVTDETLDVGLERLRSALG
jgi:aspartate/methionine/tyrosine aminotransferase